MTTCGRGRSKMHRGRRHGSSRIQAALHEEMMQGPETPAMFASDLPVSGGGYITTSQEGDPCFEDTLGQLNLEMESGSMTEEAQKWKTAYTELKKEFDMSKMSEAALLGDCNTLLMEREDFRRTHQLEVDELSAERCSIAREKEEECARYLLEKIAFIQECDTLQSERDSYRRIYSAVLKSAKGLESEIEDGLAKQEKLEADLKTVNAQLALAQSQNAQQSLVQAEIVLQKDAEISVLRSQLAQMASRKGRGKRQKVSRGMENGFT